MPQNICRLCLSAERLINTFDARLKWQDELRNCILLCTGVDIQENDQVSKFVCNNCCTIAVKLFKYRRNAIANDKALKKYVGQQYMEPVSEKDDILKLHASILATFVNTEKIEPEIDCNISFAEKSISRAPTRTTSAAVHTSIIQLFKRHPKVIIPNELLQYDIDPKIALNKEEVRALQTQVTNDGIETVEPEIEEIDRFRQKCPAINIVRIQAHNKESITKPQNSEDIDVLPIQASANKIENKKRHRLISESPEIIPTKRKRIFSKESKSLNKMELPDKSPSDTESKKRIFTSSLELTTSDKITEKVREIEPVISDREQVVPLEGSHVNDDVQDTGFADYLKDALENSFLTPMSKVEVVVCGTCNKVYQSKSQLKNHEKRSHQKCLVCHSTHKSQTKSFRHLQETCMDYIKVNQPFLNIPRVDNISHVVETYKEAFDYFKEMANASEDVVVVNEFNNLSDAEEIDETPDELKFMESVFKRHRGISTIPHSMKCTQTNRREMNVELIEDNLVLLKMYPDLLIYKVPVDMTVQQKISAHLSDTVRPKPYTHKDSWNPSEAIDLITKTTNSVHELKSGKRKRLETPKMRSLKTLLEQDRKKAAKSKMVKDVSLLTNGTSNLKLDTVSSVTLKESDIAKRIDKLISQNDEVLSHRLDVVVDFSKSNNVTKRKYPSVSEINNINSNMPDVNTLTNVLVVESRPNSLPSHVITRPYIPFSNGTPSALYTSGDTTIETTDPSTAGTADSNSFLRVKAPWELNQI